MIKERQLLVSSGRRYVLSNLILHDDSSSIKVTENRPFDSANTALAVESQLQEFRDKGYLYVAGQTDKVTTEDTSVELSLLINKGPQVKSAEPLIAGLTRTDRKIVKRYLPDNRDGVLTSNYLEELNTAAAQIPFVRFQPPLTLQPRPGYSVSDILLNFFEKTPVRFEGAAGITGGESSQPVWSFNLSFNNLLGQGKRVEIKSERPDPRRSLLNVAYSQPLWLSGLGEITLAVQTRDYRDEFYDFVVTAGYQTRINRRFVAGLDLEWKSSKPETGSAGYNRYSGQFSISRRTFSENFNPKSGLSLKWGIGFSHRKYRSETLTDSLDSRTFNESRNSLSAQLYQPIAGPIQIQSSVKYMGMESGEELPPLSELMQIGGPGTIRGYRTEQFMVVRAALATIEPRVRFRQGFVFAFYDAAYLNNRQLNANDDIITNEQFKWSYGVGFGLGSDERSVLMSLAANYELGLGEPRLSIELSSDI
jgi:outer membrane protein assembly factor BamA